MDETRIQEAMNAEYARGYNQAIKDVLQLWMMVEDPQDFIKVVQAMRNICFDSSPTSLS